MEDDIKEMIAFIVVILLGLTGFVYMLKWSDKEHEQNRQKEQQEIQECYDKTDDLNYCLDIFNK